MSNDIQQIPIEQVKIGMFIKLDLSWFEHSFPTSAFKITNQRQLQELLALNLKHVTYIPSKSDLALIKAALSNDSGQAPPPVNEEQKQVFANIAEAKRARLEKLKQQREEIERCKEKFVHAANVVKNINQTIFHSPAETIKEADKLISNIAEAFLTENDTVMHLMQASSGKEEIYFHNLNVSVLAMMLANALKCNENQIKQVGMAGLFHDLGKAEIPDAVLKKTEKLTHAEQNFIELHPEYGKKIALKAGLPDIVIEVIANHHELLDASGYPNKLTAAAIRKPVRIVTIANVYDNLCNHLDPAKSLTPHEALSTMYARQRAQLDQEILAVLIKNLGVYPPGTLVRLSNEAIGLVVNVNLGKPLRPCVLIYDEDIPKEDAMILDLSQESAELSVNASIRPGLLSRAVLEYLNPRKRVNYYFDTRSQVNSNSPTPR